MRHRGDSCTTRMRSGARLVAGLAALATLAACGSASTPASKPAATPTATHTVVDMSGRSVTLPTHVTRIASAYPALAESMLLLGAAKDLVATAPGPGPFFNVIDPAFAKVPQPFDQSSNIVNMEALLTARPQVVFASSPALVTPLTQVGIPVVVFSVFTSPTQIKQAGDLIAKIVGTPSALSRSKKFDQYYDSNVAEVTAKTKSIPAAQQPVAYYTAANPLQTEGGGSIVTTWMNEAGAQNAAAIHGISAPPTFATPNLEEVVSWNPDFIVCRDAATVQQILSDPAWSSVTAVKNHAVYAAPEGAFDWPVRSLESALQPLWAAKTFHPDLFASINLVQSVKTFYSEFYSYNVSTAQAQAILDRTPIPTSNTATPTSTAS